PVEHLSFARRVQEVRVPGIHVDGRGESRFRCASNVRLEPLPVDLAIVAHGQQHGRHAGDGPGPDQVGRHHSAPTVRGPPNWYPKVAICATFGYQFGMGPCATRCHSDVTPFSWVALLGEGIMFRTRLILVATLVAALFAPLSATAASAAPRPSPLVRSKTYTYRHAGFFRVDATAVTRVSMGCGARKDSVGGGVQIGTNDLTVNLHGTFPVPQGWDSDVDSVGSSDSSADAWVVCQLEPPGLTFVASANQFLP